MKVLVTGASGQVGNALASTRSSDIELQAYSRVDLDITDLAALEAAVASFRPDLIVNAAAFTAVDLAESQPEVAVAVNSTGPANLAEAAKRLPGCRLLHISTDYVFDGTAVDPYRIDSVPSPVNQYGRSKLLGERAVLDTLSERAGVLRTAWVYAPHGRNFLLTMLRNLRQGRELRVVNDQRGSPTAALSIARALWTWAKRPDVHGILHWTDAGVTSWFGFACAIATFGLELGLYSASPSVKPISTDEYPTAAKRPTNSSLDISEAASKLALEPLPWDTSLRANMLVWREQLKG